ncbi:NAD(P)/FAD-dependent oxidoreductase [Paenibacillus radicis (ex Gao et al. 2016)]|uniref:Oxidoreductase n=1 Tax=Paenibacillus radicis (ex Gao et al. 2016) TaxID=1737354 RepID=A0A917M8U0_9BACL|nr:FAD-dependent oxidoreductase [Paenibacillus radicis (ex Gao et al. 2016)]GGG82485.1 oxidoreductase [Paenibacillus radicis (ex Gao et al. 2016)]
MKELHTGELFWPTTLQSVQTYEPLGAPLQVDVAIVGGGMSGIVCGLSLAEAGISAAVLERGTIAGGSSSANTGLLQFSNDIMLCDLIDQIGEGPAVQFYKACEEAVKRFGQICEQLPRDVGFRNRSSLYYASSEQDLPKLKREFETLKKHGFDVEFWSPDDISSRFPFRRPGAIITRGDAEINPFRFIQTAADHAARAGLRIYEHTDITGQRRSTNADRHILTTADGHEVTAKHVIFAIGYEPEELRGRLVKAELNRSFAAVTRVQPSSLLDRLWPERLMIWETARPYLYLRTTVDDRIVIGGLDEHTEHPIEGEKARHKRIRQLQEKLHALFPGLDSEFDYEWSATFGESRDNLPFIGEDPNIPGLYYGLGYGGNGSVYSIIAAQIIRDSIQGKDHPIAPIVGLDRPSLLKI